MFQTVEMPSKLRMFEGKYTVKLFVVEADPNGIEIDKCLLQFECSDKCSLDTLRKITKSNNERSVDTNENKSGEDDLLNVNGTNGTNSNFDFDLTTAEKIGIGIAASLVAIIGALCAVPLTCYICSKNRGYKSLEKGNCCNHNFCS